MVDVPDYSFISKDTGPSLSQSVGNWLTIDKSVMDLRQQRANEAAGQAFLNSIDPATGQPRQNLLLQNLQRNPATAMAAQVAAQRGQTLTGDEYDLHNKRVNGAMGAMGQLIADNPNGVPADAMRAGIDQQHALGNLTNQEAEAMHGRVSDDPRANTQLVIRGMAHGLSAQQALDAAKPSPSVQNIGGQIVTLQPSAQGASSPTPSLSQGAGGVNTTLTPEATVGLPSFTYTNPATGRPVVVPGADAVKIFGYGALLPPGAQGHVDLPPGWTQVSGGGGAGTGGGVVGADGKPVSAANPPRLLNVPGQPPAAAPYQGTGTGTAADTAPIYQPPAGAPQAPPATLQPPGPRSSLEGGVPVVSANALAPTVGAAGPPSPLVPGDVNAIMAGMDRARATPAQGTQTAAAFSFGPSAEEAQGFKTSADKLAADDLAATEWQSTKLPYVEALKNYGEGTKTGPTTDFWNQVAGTIRTPLAKIGINVGPLSDTTERVDALGKWLASIQSTNPVSAKSDAELAQVLKGSASTHINEVAGEDMVKAGFTLRRMGAALNNDWHNNPALQTQYGTYLRYLGDMNNKIDPRAFSIDMLNPSQKQRLVAAIKSSSDADAERFESSLALARRARQVP